MRRVPRPRAAFPRVLSLHCELTTLTFPSVLLTPPKVWSGTAPAAFSRSHFSVVPSLLNTVYHCLGRVLGVQGRLDPIQVLSKGKDRMPKDSKLEDLWGMGAPWWT